MKSAGDKLLSVDGALSIPVDIRGKGVSVLFVIVPVKAAESILRSALIDEQIERIEFLCRLIV